MRLVEALQVLPTELTPADLVPPAIIVSLVALGRLLLQFVRQRDDVRQRADASTWTRMERAYEVVVAQRDDAIRQVEQRDGRIRQLAEHITDLESRNDDLRQDNRDLLRQVANEREEPT